MSDPRPTARNLTYGACPTVVTGVPMRSAIAVFAIIVLGALLSGCSSEPTDQERAASASRVLEALTKTVTYEVYLDPQSDTVYETEVMTADMTLETAGGTSQTTTQVAMKDVAGVVPAPYLAYSSQITLSGSPYISAQNTTGYGAVTCKIKEGARVIADVTSDSKYGIATCHV